MSDIVKRLQEGSHIHSPESVCWRCEAAERIRVLEDALRKIDGLRDRCVYRRSGAAPEEFMEGSNTAFGQAADIAREALDDVDSD